MGDMADFALDQMMDVDEIVVNSYNAPYDELDDYEKEIVFRGQGRDEYERSLGVRKARGPGPCPKCQAETRLMKGQFGQFYGCPNFPKCKGSRNP